MVKLLLTKAPILIPPTDGEPLLLLVVEREEKGHALKV